MYRGPKRELEIQGSITERGNAYLVRLVYPEVEVSLPISLVDWTTREGMGQDRHIARIPRWLHERIMKGLRDEKHTNQDQGDTEIPF